MSPFSERYSELLVRSRTSSEGGRPVGTGKEGGEENEVVHLRLERPLSSTQLMSMAFLASCSCLHL